jgi:Holliday junction resolvase RusA-like endonuclease
MSSRFTEKQLLDMGLVRMPDGSYEKIKKQIVASDLEFKWRGNPKDSKIPPEAKSRKITLTLFGIPMPKQSVRATKSGHFFQPKETVDRKKSYIKQIKEQLPEDFLPFEHEVHITKLHFIFPPLKAFHNIKGRMEAIREGEVFYKNTKGDLDNYCKILFDSLNEVAMKDDALIVSMDGVKKIYGVGGCVILEMDGY